MQANNRAEMRVGIFGLRVDTRVFQIKFLVEKTWLSKTLPARIILCSVELNPGERIHMKIPLNSPPVLTRTRIGAIMHYHPVKMQLSRRGTYKQDP